MKYLFIFISLVMFFNSCTNRYEGPSSTYKKVDIKKRVYKQKTVYKAAKRYKRTKQKVYTKKAKKYKKSLQYISLNKKLLEVDYLRYSYYTLRKNFFSNRIMLSQIVTEHKKHYLAKSKKRYKKSNKEFRSINNKKRRKLYLTATAYTSHRSQTDSTPFLAAWNNRIKPGMKIVAVSHDLIKKYGLKNGKVVKIKGLKGHYVVKDKMNKRFKKRIDIYMGLNKKRALRWGKRKVVLYY